MHKVKSFFITLLVMAFVVAMPLMGVLEVFPKAWNFGYFTSALVAVALALTLFCEGYAQAELKEAFGKDRLRLLEKTKSRIEKHEAYQFKGRSFIFGIMWLLLIAVLVYAGALLLAGAIGVLYALNKASLKARKNQYEELIAADEAKKATSEVAGSETSSVMGMRPTR